MAIKEDLQHKINCYYNTTSFKYLFKVLQTDGTSVIFLYRLNQFLLKLHLGPIATFVRSINRIINACWIGRNAQFGEGLVIMHPYGVVINSNVKGGKNIIIQSGVVIGVAKDGAGEGVPVLGNNIVIGAGAKVLGGIKIGDNVKIGANAVVVKDVPNGATVVGIPAKIIKIANQE